MSVRLRTCRSTLAIAVALAFPSWAAAQATAQAPAVAVPTGDSQTVIIRARGRDETQQSVPISVKAFSEKSIEDAGIKGVGDFVAITPNLSLAESQSAGTSFMTIRGLSQVRNGEAPMAVVVDGVIQSDAKQFTQELFDIRSIEVLRGPQGALYGRNATGGAILIHTKQPTNLTEGFARVTLGNGGEKGLQGAVGGAIVPDKLFFRVAASVTDRDGYLENIYLNRKFDDFKDKSLRGLLKWNVSDRLFLDLRANVVRTSGGSVRFQYQPTHLLPNCEADPANVFDFSRLDANHVVRTFCANNMGINHRDLDEVTVKADYDLGFATLSGIYSVNRIDEFISGDQYPYTASRNVFGIADGTQTQYANVKTDSLEVRLTSPTKAGLRWMAGAYMLNTKRWISTSTGRDDGTGVVSLYRDPRIGAANNPTQSWIADDNDNKASAVFANLDYDFTPKVEASLAMRYDRDERSQLVDSRGTAGLPTGCTASTPAACTRNLSFTAAQPKASLRYKLDDRSLAYVSLGKGFRSGQFNQFGVATAAAGAGVVGVTDEIGAERTTSFEAGYKTELAGGKVQLNMAVFDSKVRNAPFFVFIGAVSAQVLVGIDELSLRGGEIEAVAKVAPGLDLYAGLGVTDSKIKRYTVDPTAVGKKAPYVPDMTVNVGGQYRFAMGNGMNLLLRSDVIRKGKQYWEPDNNYPRSAFVLINLRAALEDGKGKWSAALTVNNATDKAYNSEWVGGGFAHPAPPRTYRADVRYNF